MWCVRADAHTQCHVLCGVCVRVGFMCVCERARTMPCVVRCVYVCVCARACACTQCHDEGEGSFDSGLGCKSDSESDSESES